MTSSLMNIIKFKKIKSTGIIINNLKWSQKISKVLKIKSKNFCYKKKEVLNKTY